MVKSAIVVGRPHRSRQPVGRVVGQGDGMGLIVVRDYRDDGPKISCCATSVLLSTSTRTVGSKRTSPWSVNPDAPRRSRPSHRPAHRGRRNPPPGRDAAAVMSGPHRFSCRAGHRLPNRRRSRSRADGFRRTAAAGARTRLCNTHASPLFMNVTNDRTGARPAGRRRPARLPRTCHRVPECTP